MTENLKVFTKLIQEQFEYGGKKYADSQNSSRETTDILFDVFGAEWLYGTICKYTFRYENVHREKDLLKIATYAYLLWLKRGFFEVPDKGTLRIKDTNVQMKIEFYPIFIQSVNSNEVYVTKNCVAKIREILVGFVGHWFSIRQENLAKVFLLAYQEWNEKFSHIAGQDADTNNTDDS